MAPFRLQEKLVRILIRERTELVFYAGTIAGTLPVNASGKEGRAVKTRAQDIVYPLIGVQQKAVHLLSSVLNRGRNIQERKALRLRISGLPLQAGGVHRTEIDARRRAGLHPGRGNTQRSQLFGNPVRGFLTDTPSLEGMLADEHPSVQKGSGG